jgi:hypothetical protein
MPAGVTTPVYDAGLVIPGGHAGAFVSEIEAEVAHA